MPPVASCPKPELLRRFLHGEVADDRVVDALAKHVDRCAACAEAIARMPTSDTLADRCRDTAIGSVPPELRGVMDRLQRSTGTSEQTTDGEKRGQDVLEVLGPRQAADEIGRLAQYRVLKLLGQGGMGAVFLAHDPQLDRQVALKVMLPGTTAKGRFLREARLAARIEHDHIVPIYQIGEHQGLPYLAMPVLKGVSLAELLKQRERLDVALVLRLARQMASGLAAAHEQGLIHRDVKPANIWVEPNDGGRIKILDFGLARLEKEDIALTQSGVIVGTPAYMSPEQARGQKVDARTDLWSLGVILFEMAASTRPFNAPTTMGILTSIAVDQPALPANVHPGLANLIMRLLEKDPNRRAASAGAVVEAIAKLEGQLVNPSPEPNNPWAEIVEASATAPLPAPVSAATMPQKKPPRPAATAPTKQPPRRSAAPAPSKQSPRRRVLAVIAAGFLFLVGGGFLAQQIVIRITNKEGKTREIEVQPGEKVEIVQKAATAKAKEPQAEKEKAKGPQAEYEKAKDPQPPKFMDPDRRAAAYVLSIDGRIWVNGQEFAGPADQLPKGCQLTHVDLKENHKVTDAGLASFKGCKRLRSLNLYHTPVTEAGLAHFKDCKNLKFLQLEGASVNDAGVANFKDCEELSELFLTGTQVSEAGLAHFKNCKDLTSLELMGTPVTPAGLAHFKNCKDLAYLGLHTSPVTDAGLAYFKDCKNLGSINLGHTRISDDGLTHFLDCKNLAWMHLAGTRVTAAGLTRFKDCKSLSGLVLLGTKMSDPDLRHLESLTNLKELDLRQTMATKDGVGQLQRALPKCQINWDGK